MSYQFAPQGLIITNAMYYNMDVTGHLQNHVNSNAGKIHIPHGTQYNDFFGRDPAPGVGKQLVITYRDGPYGQEQRVTFNECQAVDIHPQPQQQQFAPSGVIVTNAMYYNMDVTAHLQKHIAGHGGALHIAHGTQYNDFFGRDPAPGVGKQLVITYKDSPYGVEQRASFNECQAVDIKPSANNVNVTFSQGGQTGLIIQNAMYHNMDVTAHLQNHVNSNGGKVHIAHGTQYNDFFGRDPAPGVGKQLIITYRDGPYGQAQTRSFGECQAVDITPQPQAQVYPQQTGLIIQNAMYYNMDVTAHLQKHLAGHGGALHIAHGTQYNDFFGRDPAPGVGKQLVITYRDGPYGQEQRATFNECQAVDIKPSQQQFAPQTFGQSGLIIQNAMYYNMDVTAHLQKHAASGALHIAHGTDYNNFFGRDPLPGVAKQLVITYKDSPYGQEQRATFNERQAVDIKAQPQQQQQQYIPQQVVVPQQQVFPQHSFVNVTVTQSYPSQISESGFFGGSGGNHFSTYNPSLGPANIQNIIVHAGSMLDSLQVVYNNGQSSQRFGGSGGNRHDVNLGYGEHIVRVDVRAGSLVDSIAFTTNTGRTFGPFGGSGGSHHYHIAQQGQQLIGLKGRSGTLIDAVNAVFGANAAQMTP